MVTHVQVWTRVSVCGDTCAGMYRHVFIFVNSCLIIHIWWANNIIQRHSEHKNSMEIGYYRLSTCVCVCVGGVDTTLTL